MYADQAAPRDAEVPQPPSPSPTPEWGSSTADPGDAGQTTAEYALVLLGAAAIAAVLLKWATSSSGLTKLFTAILRRIIQGIAG